MALPTTTHGNVETQLRQLIADQDMKIQELMVRAAHVMEKPFEETEEFRDFVVWLCGFTDREDPPNKKEWQALQDRAKKVAAKFALQARDRAREALQKQEPFFSRTASGYLQNTIDTHIFDNQTSTTTGTYYR